VANSYCRFENLLTEAEWDDLLLLVRSIRGEFVPSTTTSGDTGHRRSQVLPKVPDRLRRLVEHRLEGLWPPAALSLGFSTVQFSRIVVQVTAHLDGDYYRTHADSGPESNYRRIVSYVYYLHEEPRQFTGGELVISGGDQQRHVITPAGNSIALFPSSLQHEVTLVHGGRDIHSARLTINGWIYR
jgi:SM-20-related protein